MLGPARAYAAHMQQNNAYLAANLHAVLNLLRDDFLFTLLKTKN